MSEKVTKQPIEQERKPEEVLGKIHSSAKRIILAQPLNPFEKLTIIIKPRGRLF